MVDKITYFPKTQSELLPLVRDSLPSLTVISSPGPDNRGQVLNFSPPAHQSTYQDGECVELFPRRNVLPFPIKQTQDHLAAERFVATPQSYVPRQVLDFPAERCSFVSENLSTLPPSEAWYQRAWNTMSHLSDAVNPLSYYQKRGLRQKAAEVVKGRFDVRLVQERAQDISTIVESRDTLAIQGLSRHGEVLMRAFIPGLPEDEEITAAFEYLSQRTHNLDHLKALLHLMSVSGEENIRDQSRHLTAQLHLWSHHFQESEYGDSLREMIQTDFSDLFFNAPSSS